MRLYTFHSQFGQAYLIHAADNCDCCEPDPPRALAPTWTPPEFELVRDDELEGNLPKTDFPTYLPSAIMLSARAAERLAPILTPCGELLPIRVINDPDRFYFFNVTRVINAVDMKRSKFLDLPSGAIGPCEPMIFDPALIPGDALFFKNTQMGTITEIFASERAVKAVLGAGLTGHDFRLAWSNESSS
jgi:hypothetical protein